VEATITNETTGDAISIYFVHSVDDELEIDTDLKTVTYLTDNSNQFSALTLEGAIRRDWLPLVPGNNTLRWDETGAGSLTVALEWKERTYE
jgi:phage-related protein